MLKQLIIELLRLGLALATMLLTRWMFELKRLKWYRGMEYIHQIKFRRYFS